MTQYNAAPTRDWFHYLIVIAIAGVVGSGVALFITNRHNAEHQAPPANLMSADADTAAENSLQPEKDSTPPTPSINDEPPPMLAGNMPPPQAALALGNWYFDHQNWKKAIDKYESAIKLGIDNADIRTDLGSAYRFSGNAKKALEEYERAHKMNPRHENSLFNQGAVYVLMLKQPQKGVDIWKEYLKEFPHGESAENAKKLIAHAQEEFKLKK
jgi:tetratricopeptide (TPR) repeat protein